MEDCAASTSGDFAGCWIELMSLSMSLAMSEGSSPEGSLGVEDVASLNLGSYSISY